MRRHPFVATILGSILLTVLSCQKAANNSTPVQEPPTAWVSSGGELFVNNNNPWFLENVDRVRYCVAVDQATISLPVPRIEAVIEKALQYWKKEFREFQKQTRAATLLPRVASQAFEKIDCDGSEDLRFQFGYGTLSQGQLGYLDRQHQYVSLAVRTGYDTQNLRGRGFIYIASDQGPHRQPQGGSFVDQPWRFEGLLFRVVTHELGHVFGLPHIGEGLMNAGYPEYILRTDVFAKYQTVEPFDSFFLAQLHYANCTLSEQANGEAMKWLGISASDKCLYLDLASSNERRAITVKFSVSRDAESERILIGTATGDFEAKDLAAEISLAGQIYLEPDRKLFIDPPYDKIKYLPTSVFLNLGMGLSYSAVKGAVRPLFIKLKPNGYEIIALSEGKLKNILSFERACLNVMSYLVCMEP